MKTITVIASSIALALASTSAMAIDLSTTVTNGTTNSTVNVNQHVTGVVNGVDFEYKQNRGAGLDATGCGTGQACNGNDSLTVGIDLTATQRITNLDQLTTGLQVTTAENCDVTVSIGGLSNSQGVRSSSTVGETTMVNNNVTTITSGTVAVNTITDASYTGWNGSSKPGNDFTAVINGISVNSEGESIDVAGLSSELLSGNLSVTVQGQDLDSADMNGLNVSWSVSDLQVLDTSVTVTGTESTSTTTFENLN